mgnify:CR=1 FL=1
MTRRVKSSKGLLCTVAILFSMMSNTSCVSRSAPVATVEQIVVPEEPAQPVLTLHPSGVGSWRLGMSPRQVFIQPDCKPFLPVRVTGGIECPNFLTPLGERTISFEFNSEVLSKIQVRLYQGDNSEEWAMAIWRSFEVVGLEHQIALDEMTLSVLGAETMSDQAGFVNRVTELAEAGLPLSFSFVIDPHLSHRRWLSAIYNPRGVASVYLFVGEG